MVEFKKASPWLKACLFVGFLVLGVLIVWFFRRYELTSETLVEVVEVKPAGQGLWLVPGYFVSEKSGLTGPFVTRLRYLQAQRLKVKIIDKVGNDFILKSDDLKTGDLLILKPETVPEGKAVILVTGLTDERLIGLVIEAGIAAAMDKDLDQSARFISPDYRDAWGFNASFMRQLFKRAYKEFDDPVIELTEPLLIQVHGRQALVQVEVRLSATYRGRRNYLLGDAETPNRILLRLNKSAKGWKVTSIDGLQPLGFEEQFLRFLGAEVGLPLTSDEQQKKQEYCMPCRKRMVDRFGL